MAGQNAAWDKRYAKWDKFDDDSDDEETKVDKFMNKPTVLDHEGDVDVKVVDQILLSEVQQEKLMKIDQKANVIWQIVVRKLRVWSASSKGAAEGEDAIPCRPFCLMVNNLYPLGQVLEKEVCNPPETYPSPQYVLEMVTKVMTNPPKNTMQHRPDKIVFPDKNLVGALRKTFAQLEVECSYLSESDGIDDYVSQYSNVLVSTDAASIGDSSEKPGCLSVSGNTVEILRGLYSAVSSFVKHRPWESISERQCIELTSTAPLVVDQKLKMEGSERVYAALLGSTDIFGIGLFYSRPDLERRMLPKGEKLAYMEDPALRICAACDKRANEEGEEIKKLKRCTRCEVVFYCDANCQKKHWAVHKKTCTKPSDTNKDEIFWAVKEVSMFLGTITTIPFGDLDAIDTYDLPIYDDKEGFKLRYPSFVQFRNGTPSVPEPKDLVWLERAILAFLGLLKDSPKYMEESLPEVLGETNTGIKPLELKVPTSHAESTETMILRNATVLTLSELQSIRATQS